MSWSGPVAGAAPFPPAYPGGQALHTQQRGYQYGQLPPTTACPPANAPQRPPDVRPPKKKGNPIITRYPPPPGYRPPQPPAPFGGGQYTHPYHAPQYPHVHQQHASPPQTYPPQEYPPVTYGHSQPPAYPPQPYSSHQNHQWPQSVRPPTQSHPPAPGAVPNFPLTPSSYGGHPPHSVSAGYSQPVLHQASGWPVPHQQPAYTSDQSTFYAAATPDTTHIQDHSMGPPQNTTHSNTLGFQSRQQPASAAPKTVSIKTPQLVLEWDDWDFDFDGAIWPKSNEPVDPDLSLGVIIWRPAKQMTRALPSTFTEAEEQALSPTPEKLGNGESVSVYFMAENSHEAFLDVRQTDQWAVICDDPIFVVFTDEQLRNNLVSLEDCIAQRDRPDDTTDHQPNEDQKMHDATWNVMDNLEQALTGNVKSSNSPSQSIDGISFHIASQEDVLARLGVTGPAKPQSDEVLKASLSGPYDKSVASRPVRSGIDSHSVVSQSQLPHTRITTHHGQKSKHINDSGQPTGSVESIPSASIPPPPSPPPIVTGDYSQCVRISSVEHCTPQQSPVTSEGINHTMADSDFETENTNQNAAVATSQPAIPSFNRSNSSFTRKRNYEVDEQDEKLLLLQDDHSKRKRRFQVDAAYSRR